MKLALAYAAASTLLLLMAAAQAEPPVAEPAPATKGSVDGLVSSPANFKLLLEKSHVRALQYTLLPARRINAARPPTPGRTFSSNPP